MEFLPIANQILLLFVFRILSTGYVKCTIKLFFLFFFFNSSPGDGNYKYYSTRISNLISYTALLSKQSKFNVNTQDAEFFCSNLF